MSSVNKAKFRSIVKKYLNGTADADEIAIVEKYYELFADKPDRLSGMPADEIADIDERIRGNIAKRTTGRRARTMPLIRRFMFRAAAAAVILVGVGWLYSITRRQDATAVNHLASTSVEPGAAMSGVVTHRSSKGQTKFVILPDGSRVVLHGEAQIAYSRDFNQKTRELSLSGEAYFDVVHLNSEGADHRPIPFVIKTGKVRTTVLGTAFSIKSLPTESEVVVTVTRGKVRVDDGGTHTALLTADEQITYNTTTVTADEKVVKSEELTAWVQADMVFQEMPFGELAEMLSKRYGIVIRFQNPGLQKCLITGRFSGTETVEEVFKILSLTSKATYTLQNGELLISGEDCR